MGEYREDRVYSDVFVGQMKNIVRSCLRKHKGIDKTVFTGPNPVDMRKNTDLIVLNGEDKIRIACRIRRPGYNDRYKNQFTVRYSRDNCDETEIDKLMDGYGNYMLYCFERRTDRNKIGDWTFIDLYQFRLAVNARDFPWGTGVLRGRKVINGDGTEGLYFCYANFRKALVVDKHRE